MKRKVQIIISASAASFLTFTAVAQERPNTKSGGTETSLERSTNGVRIERLGRVEKASDLIGLEVKNYQGEKLGKVDDLALDVETGRIVQVILSTGGFIGVGDTLHAVPPGALHCEAADKVILLNADKETLKAAPRFEMSKWAEGCESNQVAEVYRYYGERPYFTGSHMIGGTPKSERTRSIDATRAPDPNWNAGVYRNSWSRLGYVQKASKLMGTPVKNLQDEKLGKVENFALDLSAGRVIAVIVSSGGFLGLGDELSAVPPTALRFNTERDILQLDASKEALSSAPHFKSNQWPDLGQPSYADGVYRAYRVEPYFTTNAVTAADNTARNVRDRNNRTLTPLDQGNSAADRDRSAQIRKEILTGKGMSLNARNVKIITIDGQVTLRGPVNTSEEKRLIGEIAERIARSENVDNQLEVKLTTSSIN
jgi:sporulation protein YlmC with PRC-barrel domain